VIFSYLDCRYKYLYIVGAIIYVKKFLNIKNNENEEKSMDGNFSDRLQDVIRLSREEALRLGHDYIGTEHLLLGIIREGQGVAVRILRNLDCDLMKLKKAIEDTVRTSGGTLTIGNIPLTKQAEKVLKITQIESKIYKADVI